MKCTAFIVALKASQLCKVQPKTHLIPLHSTTSCGHQRFQFSSSSPVPTNNFSIINRINPGLRPTEPYIQVKCTSTMLNLVLGCSLTLQKPAFHGSIDQPNTNKTKRLAEGSIIIGSASSTKCVFWNSDKRGISLPSQCYYSSAFSNFSYISTLTRFILNNSSATATTTTKEHQLHLRKKL